MRFPRGVQAELPRGVREVQQMFGSVFQKGVQEGIPTGIQARVPQESEQETQQEFQQEINSAECFSIRVQAEVQYCQDPKGVLIKLLGYFAGIIMYIW